MRVFAYPANLNIALTADVFASVSPLHLGVLHHRVVHAPNRVHVRLHVHGRLLSVATVCLLVFASVRVCLRAVELIAGQGLVAGYLWVPPLAI